MSDSSSPWSWAFLFSYIVVLVTSVLKSFRNSRRRENE